jgi:type I restriction enzyme S subunit
MESIESGTGQLAQGELAKTPEAPEANSFRFTPAHVLYGKLRPYLNKVFAPDFQGKCSTELVPLLPNERLDRRYLAYFLRSPGTVEAISQKVAGARMPRADMSFVMSLPIPILALKEQQRIVDLLSRSENIVRMRREAEQKAKEIIPALFLDMFGDPATNPKGWTESSLGQVTAEFRYGSSQKSSANGDPVLRIPNVVGGNVDIRDLKFLTASDSDRSRYSLTSGDILFVRTNGNPDYVGRCAVFEPPDDRRWLYASYLIRGRPLSDVVDSQFLQEQLSSIEGRRRLRERARTAAGQYNINVAGLRSIPIVLPPLDRQHMFAALVRRVRELSAGSATASTVADATFQSLLTGVFHQ